MLRRGGIQSFRTMKLDYYECTIGITDFGVLPIGEGEGIFPGQFLPTAWGRIALEKFRKFRHPAIVERQRC